MAIGAVVGRPARQGLAGAAGERPGPLRRPGRGRLRGGQRALRPGGGDPALPPPRRRDAGAADQPGSRGQVVVLDGAHAGRLEGIRALAYDGTELPVTEADVKVAPRSPPATSTGAPPPLPPEGDHRGARPASARRCGAGSRARRAASTPSSASGPFPPAVAARLRAGSIRRVVVIGQGTAAVAGQSFAAILSGLVSRRRAARGGHDRDRALGLRPARRPARHARGRRQPVGHHHRHQPHGRPGSRAGRGRHRHREPPQQRPHRQGRRRALHVRRPRRGDERGLHQGLLRPGRRGRPAGLRHRRARRHRRRAPSPRAAGRAAGAARRHDRGDRPPGRHRRGRPPLRARRAATGRWWATARTRWPPRRSGSSSPSSATSRSPATSPRTRSTSTCPPSR